MLTLVQLHRTSIIKNTLSFKRVKLLSFCLACFLHRCGRRVDSGERTHSCIAESAQRTERRNQTDELYSLGLGRAEWGPQCTSDTCGESEAEWPLGIGGTRKQTNGLVGHSEGLQQEFFDKNSAEHANTWASISISTI